MVEKPRYKRIVVKMSGEALTTRGTTGIEPRALRRVAEEFMELQDLKVDTAVVVGGGNLIRGAQAADDNIERVTADQVGMLSTIVNGLVLRDILEKHGVPSSLHSAVAVGTIAASYVRGQALKDLKEGKVVIFVAGTGHPYFTTDTAASLRALEIGAEIILKATKVDGVYDADPQENPEAIKFDRISYQEVLQRRLRVVDATAISLCMEHRLPLVVFNIEGRGNMRRIILGEKEGTLIA